MQKMFILDFPLDAAFEEIDKLANRDEHDNGNTRLIKGDHPDHGRVMFIISPIGNPMMLPIASLES